MFEEIHKNVHALRAKGIQDWLEGTRESQGFYRHIQSCQRGKLT